MKRLFLLFGLLFAVVAMNAQGLFISEVADPGDYYHGRFVELYNPTASPIDLGATQTYLVKQTNGGSYYNIALTGTIAAGGTFVVAYNATDYNTYYSLTADQESTTISGNGDDGYYLYVGGDETAGTLVDAYGVPDENGTGMPWEYSDSHAVRADWVVNPNPVWDASEWVITSANVADMTPAVHTVNPVTVTNLFVSSVTPASPEMNQSFVLTVQAQDASGTPGYVASDETVTLSLTSGTGNLTGTLVGTIFAGTHTAVFSGLAYDKGETIEITATGSSLTTATETFDVTLVIPPAIDNAFYTSAGIVVHMDKDASGVAANVFALNPGGITFTTATLVATDATNQTVLLTGPSAAIENNNILDVISESAGSSSFDFYAGIMPLTYFNAVNADPIDNGYNVTVSGTVTANEGYKQLWIQDAAGAMNGLLIYDAAQAFQSTVAVDDEIEVVGQRSVYNDATELVSPVLISNSVGTGTATPTVIPSSTIDKTLGADDPDAEQWEGQLATVTGITIDSYEDDGSNHVEYFAHSSGIDIVIDDDVDYLFPLTGALTVGNVYDITGIVAFSYGQYKLNPRDGNDLAIGTAIDENASNVNVSVYPNPAMNMVRFTGEISNVVLFNAMGQKMNVLFENNAMNVSNIADGIYTARITMQNGEIVNRNIVKK